MDAHQIFHVTLAAITAGAAVVIVPVVGALWLRMRAADQNAALKQAMVERGYTADEICRVVKADNETDPDRPTTSMV